MSENVKHTPGPWEAEIGMDALVRCPDGRSFNVGDAIYHEDNRANALLIAAAPDLLAALLRLYRTADPALDEWEAAMSQAELALRKADGRAAPSEHRRGAAGKLPVLGQGEGR